MNQQEASFNGTSVNIYCLQVTNTTICLSPQDTWPLLFAFPDQTYRNKQVLDCQTTKIQEKHTFLMTPQLSWDIKKLEE